jgi:hypothetical protein
MPGHGEGGTVAEKHGGKKIWWQKDMVAKIMGTRRTLGQGRSRDEGHGANGLLLLLSAPLRLRAFAFLPNAANF